MKIKKTLLTIVSAVLAAVMLFALASCNTAGGLYSEKNAYVSVYIYTNPAATAKPKISLDRLRVAPEDEVENPETNEDNLYTDEAARQLGLFSASSGVFDVSASAFSTRILAGFGAKTA